MKFWTILVPSNTRITNQNIKLESAIICENCFDNLDRENCYCDQELNFEQNVAQKNLINQPTKINLVINPLNESNSNLSSNFSKSSTSSNCCNLQNHWLCCQACSSNFFNLNKIFVKLKTAIDRCVNLKANHNQSIDKQKPFVSNNFYQTSGELNSLETSFEHLELDENSSSVEIKDENILLNKTVFNNQVLYNKRRRLIKSKKSNSSLNLDKRIELKTKLSQIENDQFKLKTIKKRTNPSKIVKRQLKFESLNYSFDSDLSNDLFKYPKHQSFNEIKSDFYLNKNEDFNKENKFFDSKSLNEKQTPLKYNTIDKKSFKSISDENLKILSKKYKKKDLNGQIDSIHSFKNQMLGIVNSVSKNQEKNLFNSIRTFENDSFKTFRENSIKTLKESSIKTSKEDFNKTFEEKDFNKIVSKQINKKKKRKDKKLKKNSNNCSFDSFDNLIYQTTNEKLKDKKNLTTVTTKTVSSLSKAYLKTAAVALENSSYQVLNKKISLNSYDFNKSNIDFKRKENSNQCKQTSRKNSLAMFNSIKLRSQKCKIKAFHGYRSKSLTQIDCLEDSDNKNKNEKPGSANSVVNPHYSNKSSSNHLSPQHSDQVNYLNAQASSDTEECLETQKSLHFYYGHPHHHSSHFQKTQSENLYDDFENFELNNQSVDLGHQIAAESLTVPNLNQLKVYKNSSLDFDKKDLNNDQLLIRPTISKKDSSELPEDYQKNKQLSFNQQKNQANLITCDNLANETEVYSQKTSNSTSKTHHYSKKTGGIFSNPFKNEKEKLEKLNEILNFYSKNGIPNSDNQFSSKSISRRNSQQKHSQQVRSHHSTCSISSLSAILGNLPHSLNSTAISQPSSTANLQQSTYNSTSSIGNVTTAVAAAVAGGGINLPGIIPFNQSSNVVKKKNSIHSPVRTLKNSCENLATNIANLSLESKVLSKEDLTSINSNQTSFDLSSHEERIKTKSFSKQASFEPCLTEDDILYLEKNWTDIVKDHLNLSKKIHNQQDAIWELLTTEISYLQKLKVIKNLFQNCLTGLQSEGLLTDINKEKIFLNIDEVINCNLNFWSNHLIVMLNHTRLTGEPLNPILMSNGFSLFDELFSPYRAYCVEHLVSIQYVKKKKKENELFKEYSNWCETRKDCERLLLEDLLVIPMQRLTKYSLFFKVIVKKTNDEEQLKALKKMNENVECFVNSVDVSVLKRNQLETLNIYSKKIESYDAIESNNDEIEKIIKDYRVLNLKQPMFGCSKDDFRQLLLESQNLKLKDPYSSSKIDVNCLLFTDVLLICKQINKRTSERLKIIRQPFFTNRLQSHLLKDQSGLVMVYLNELNVASTFFTLYTTDTKIWIEKLNEAKRLFYNSQKSFIEQERNFKYQNFVHKKPTLKIMKSSEEDNFEDFCCSSYSNSSSFNNHSNFCIHHDLCKNNYNHTAQFYPSHSLLSSQNSSRSSLIKSQSNSIEQPDQIVFGPCSSFDTTCNLNSYNASCVKCNKKINSDFNKTYPSKNLLDKKNVTSIDSNSVLECNNCKINISSNKFLNTPKYVNQISNKQACGNQQISNSNHLKSSSQKVSKNLLDATMNLTLSENNQQRAISFELGELRNPSITVDDIDCLGRSHSMETQNPAFYKGNSLRPERRAFLLKGSSRSNLEDSSSNKTNSNFINILPSSNSESLDSNSYKNSHYCSQCYHLLSVSSSDNDNVLITSNSSKKNQRKLRNSNSSIQPPTSQIVVLRQAKSLENDNCSDDNENSIKVPVPCYNPVNEIKSNSKLDQTNVKISQNKFLKNYKPLTNTNKPPLIKMRNVNINSSRVLKPNFIESLTSSYDSSTLNVSFELDNQDLNTLEGEINLSLNNQNLTHNQTDEILAKDLSTKNKMEASKILVSNYEDTKNDEKNEAKIKFDKMPSFLIENQDEKKASTNQNTMPLIQIQNSEQIKNDLNNNLL